MRKYFKFLGIKTIYEVKDSRKEFDITILTIKEAMKAAQTSGTKLLLKVYCAGHGVIMNYGSFPTTNIVFNEVENDRYFNLEYMLTVLARYKNTYTIAVFDICRARHSKPSEQHRGKTDKKMLSEQNIKFIFGCDPGGLVIEDSTLSTSIAEMVREDVR